VHIEAPGGAEPPADPPPSAALVLANVDGNGSIVSVSSARRGQERKPPAQKIKCGVFGVACETEVQPGTSVTVRAQPGAGYVFAGWTAGCRGRARTCTVSAGSAAPQPLGAKFEPKNTRRTVAIKLRNPQLKATFKQSEGRGTLRVSGSISALSKLRIELRRPAGGPLLTRRVRAAGAFAIRALLKKGTLVRGARLFPGAFVISVSGKAGSVSVPLQLRSIFVPSPREGVVRKAYAATRRTAKPSSRLPKGVKEAWAIFRFQTQPAADTLTASWYYPDGRLVDTVPKSNRPVIETGIGSAGAIPSGAWKVELRAGAKLVKKMSVKIR